MLSRFASLQRADARIHRDHGEKTAQSLGKPLPGRRNVMLTRSKGIEVPQGIQSASVERCLREFPNARGYRWICCVGEAMLSHVTEVWLLPHQCRSAGR